MAESIDKKSSYLRFEPGWGAEPLPPIPEVPFYEPIKQTAYRYPLKTALISFERSVTYSELMELSDRFAAALVDLGVRKGDRVGVVLPNTAQHVIAFQGIIKAGAVSVPCNVMLKGHELAYLFNDAGIEVVVCLDLLCPLVGAIKGQTNVKRIISVHVLDMSEPGAWVPPMLRAQKKEIPGTLDFQVLLDTYTPEVPAVSIDPRKDLALIIYTAGTMGSPKGVMQTHYHMVYTCLNHAHVLGLDYNDSNLQLLPMFHIGGYYLFLHPLLYKGGRVVMMPMFDSSELLKLIDKHKLNLLVGPPTLYVALLNHPDISRYDLSHFKSSIAAAAPVPTILQQRWREVTGIDLNKGWGMTETNGGAIVSLPNKSSLDSIGVPMCGEVKIVKPETDDILPIGEVGEIMCRSPQVAGGYWNKPEETRVAFELDGWLHTGDAGYIGDDGFVYFVERIKDLIIASGYNIAPSYVESEIMKHPAVSEVAVIGVPDEYRGETVKACVVLKDEFKGRIAEDDILEFCRVHMAAFKRPRIVQLVDDLPKNTIGKILRRELRDKS